MDSNDKISELISQYSAESLPEDVRDIIPDFFMESIHISEQIESVGRFDYVSESVNEEGMGLSVCLHNHSNHSHNFSTHSYNWFEFFFRSDLLFGSTVETNGDGEEVDGLPALRNVLNNLDDIPENLVQCEQVFDDYFRDGCGCNRKCHEKFPKFMAFEAHLDALDADQYCPDHINHQHLLLLGAMNALVQNHPTTIAKGLHTISRSLYSDSNIKSRLYSSFS